MRWSVAVLAPLIVLAWSVHGLPHPQAKDERLSKIGRAPALALTTQDGVRISLCDLRGVQFDPDEMLRDIEFSALADLGCFLVDYCEESSR